LPHAVFLITDAYGATVANFAANVCITMLQASLHPNQTIVHLQLFANFSSELGLAGSTLAYGLRIGVLAVNGSVVNTVVPLTTSLQGNLAQMNFALQSFDKGTGGSFGKWLRQRARLDYHTDICIQIQTLFVWVLWPAVPVYCCIVVEHKPI
jgi:hypothetical protein